jgi:hypothetical protein
MSSCVRAFDDDGPAKAVIVDLLLGSATAAASAVAAAVTAAGSPFALLTSSGEKSESTFWGNDRSDRR